MPLEIIFEHTVNDEPLTIVDSLLINFIPKLRFEQNIAKSDFSAGKCRAR